MASRSNEQQAEIWLKVMRLISRNPGPSAFQSITWVGISNGLAYYVSTTLIEKDFAKLENFMKSPRAGHNAYLLTRDGIRERFLLTHSFINCKHYEFKILRAEIRALVEEASLIVKAIRFLRSNEQ